MLELINLKHLAQLILKEKYLQILALELHGVFVSKSLEGFGCHLCKDNSLLPLVFRKSCLTRSLCKST